MPTPSESMLDLSKLAPLLQEAGAPLPLAQCLAGMLMELSRYVANATALAEYTALLALLERVQPPSSNTQAQQALVILRRSADAEIANRLQDMDPRIVGMLNAMRAGAWSDVCFALTEIRDTYGQRSPKESGDVR